MGERRECGRWQIDRLASVKLQDQYNPFDGKIEDISFKGLRIHSSQELKKDSNIALSIVLDNESSLNIEASLAWDDTQGANNIYGLYFTKIKGEDKEKIYEFVRENFLEQIKQRPWEGVI